MVVEHNLLLEFFILIHATLHELIHLLCLLVTVVLYGLLSIDIVNMLTVHLLELLLVSLAWLWQSLWQLLLGDLRLILSMVLEHAQSTGYRLLVHLDTLGLRLWCGPTLVVGLWSVVQCCVVIILLAFILDS